MKRDLRIIVLHRGWVLVGDYKRNKDYVSITKANVIRYWGTTDGLGQLALMGPTTNTKLDKISDVEAHESQIIFTAKCDGAKWKTL